MYSQYTHACILAGAALNIDKMRKNKGNLLTSCVHACRLVQVRGVLNKEEVVMAKSGASFLKAVHVVVGTPQVSE